MLVTGASGFLGQHLVRGDATKHWEIIAPSSRSMDITHRDNTIDTIRDWKPDVVVHLAYRKDRRTIVDGTRNVAEGATAAGAHLIHMSSDNVFGGRPEPYRESDLPQPIIDYGRNKLDAEAAARAGAPDATVVRTSLLYGTDRLSPIQHQLAATLPSGHSPMTFFTDEVRCPAHADDVAHAISQLAESRPPPQLVHVAGPEGVSRSDLAAAMCRHLGLAHSNLATSTITESGLVRPSVIVLDTSLAAEHGITCRPVAATLG